MTRKKRVLIVCTGNSARSQMAEALLRHDCGDRFDLASAGTKPMAIAPEAIAVMAEIGIGIESQRSKNVAEFKGQDFDFIITVCDQARSTCPMFPGKAKSLHKGFPDPAAMQGSEAVRMDAFRSVRDEIRAWLGSFARAIRA